MDIKLNSVEHAQLELIIEKIASENAIENVTAVHIDINDKAANLKFAIVDVEDNKALGLGIGDKPSENTFQPAFNIAMPTLDKPREETITADKPSSNVGPLETTLSPAFAEDGGGDSGNIMNQEGSFIGKNLSDFIGSEEDKPSKEDDLEKESIVNDTSKAAMTDVNTNGNYSSVGGFGKALETPPTPTDTEPRKEDDFTNKKVEDLLVPDAERSASSYVADDFTKFALLDDLATTPAPQQPGTAGLTPPTSNIPAAQMAGAIPQNTNPMENTPPIPGQNPNGYTQNNAVPAPIDPTQQPSTVQDPNQAPIPVGTDANAESPQTSVL